MISKWRPAMCFNFVLIWIGLEPGTDYQATRKVLLNQMLKPFAIPPFNIIQQPFYSIQQNRTDVEANVEAVCSGLNMVRPSRSTDEQPTWNIWREKSGMSTKLPS